MSEFDDVDCAENYMEQDDYSDNESESMDMKQIDKRAHHNALERKRRDHIKDSFSSLRDAIPLLHNEKINSHKASRAQILKKAAEYIDHMRRKNNDHQKDIDVLKRENKLLEEKIRALEELKCAGQLKTNNNNNTNNSNSNNINSKQPTRTRNKSLIVSNNGSSTSLSTNNSTNSSSAAPVQPQQQSSNENGVSILQQNRIKSESFSSFETNTNSDDSENLSLENNAETVVQIVKKGNVIPNGTTLLLTNSNGTIIKQANASNSLLNGPPSKRTKRLVIAANTSIISK